jgi:TonB family protein
MISRMTPKESADADAKAAAWLERFRSRQPVQVATPAPSSLPVFQVGKDVVSPQLVRQVRPAYTRKAMDERIQGVVVVSGVVLPDGALTDVRVVRSLDAKYGLDQEALKAARQWRFVPGTKDGVPVAVQISIELTFTLK